jgi:uncharacterized protein (DUF4415 family)
MGKTVIYDLDNLPPVTGEDSRRADSIRDEDISFSDIPEFKSLKGFVPLKDRHLYRPIKIPITCKLDADVLAWLKSGGKGYQTRINAILRKEMVSETETV